MIASSTRAQVNTVIERIEPTSGPIGTSIDIVGRGFEPAMSVTIGETPMEVTGRLPNRWTVRVPNGSATGVVALRTASRTFPGPEFRVTAAPPAPTITRVTPTSVLPGGEIVIDGTNFSARFSENTVLLGGRPLVVRAATPFRITAAVPETASSGTLSVRVLGAGEATAMESVNVGARTAVASFSPVIGPPGTRVTVRGAGFSARAGETRVFLNNVAARVERAAESELLVTVPPSAATGPFVVDVRGGGRATATAPFTVAFPPQVRAVEPAAATPGRTVVIRGENFGTDVRAVRVMLGSVPMNVRAVSARELSVDVPATAATGRISVTISELPPATLASDFTVLVPVTVASFAPESGPAGSRVTITGAGFSPTVTDNEVAVSNANATVISASATELVVLFPTNTPSGPLAVTVAGNGTARSARPFIVTRPPTVTGFQPVRLVTPGELTIRGTSFGPNPAAIEVTIADRRMEVVRSSETEILVRVPNGAVGGRPRVSVRLQGSAEAVNAVEIFSPLSVTGVSAAEVAIGTPITVNGTGFGPGTRVLFGAVESVPLIVNEGELRVVAPTGAGAQLSVRSTDGRTAAHPAALTINPAPAGVAITLLAPECVHAGCNLWIRGHGFGSRANLNRVTFGTQSLRVKQASADALLVQLPRVTETAPIRVEVRAAGRGAAGGNATSEPFTVFPVPTAAPNAMPGGRARPN